MKEVKIGSKIIVKFGEEEETIELVSQRETDISLGKISVDSLFGKAVVGKKEGAIVSYLNNLKKSTSCVILKINNS
ncbi:MAG: GreA/GreB family elongation factor [Patescibacteria group bacterium]